MAIDINLTVEKIASDDINFKSSGTTRQSFTRTSSTGGQITVYKVDAKDIQFRSLDKYIENLIDGSGDVPIDVDSITLTDKNTLPVSDALIYCDRGELKIRDASDANYIDIHALGGLKSTFFFHRDQIDVSLTNDPIEVMGEDSLNYITLPFNGSILAISVALYVPQSAGSFSLVPTLDGISTGLSVTIDTNNKQYNYITTSKDSITFNAGQRLGVNITTGPSWSPTNNDLIATVVVEF